MASSSPEPSQPPPEPSDPKPVLRKPEFKKVEQLRPGTTGHTLTVNVISSNTVLAKGRSVSHHLRQTRIAECVVGDDTGTIVFTARNEQGISFFFFFKPRCLNFPSSFLWFLFGCWEIGGAQRKTLRVICFILWILDLDVYITSNSVVWIIRPFGMVCQRVPLGERSRYCAFWVGWTPLFVNFCFCSV